MLLRYFGQFQGHSIVDLYKGIVQSTMSRLSVPGKSRACFTAKQKFTPGVTPAKWVRVLGLYFHSVAVHCHTAVRHLMIRQQLCVSSHSILAFVPVAVVIFFRLGIL